MRRAFTRAPIGKIAMAKSQLVRGFTLVEIMVVVAVVIIIVTISVPSILRSRVVANEGAAIASLKTLYNACQSYHIDAGGYPDMLLQLSGANPPYIDNVLGTGQKQGYAFIYQSSDNDHFTINANPIHTGLLRGRYFYMDEGGAIRGNIDGSAGPDDAIIQ